MAIFAFLFGHRSPDAPIADGDVRTRIVRALVAESVAGVEISTTIRDGLTLFEDLAVRPTQVRKFRGGQPPPRDDLAAVRGEAARPFKRPWTVVISEEVFAPVGEPDWVFSVRSQSDPRAVMYLLSDFAEAHREAWHTGDPRVIDTELAAGPLTAFAVAPVPRCSAARLHNALANAAGYLGAMEVDAGHPGLFRVLWTGLIPTHQVVGTNLRFLDNMPGHEADRYALDEEEEPGDNWWWQTGASSFSWIAEAGAYGPSNAVKPLPDSPRGATVREHLSRLVKLSPMEQIISELADDPAKFPPGPQTFSASKMPGADGVTVPEAKLAGYALNPAHPSGRHKARLFRELLGIEADDWRFLAGQLRRGVRRAPALRQVRGDEFGVRFDVVVAVKGRNGAVKPVLSGWILRPGQPASLTTAWVARRGTEADVAADDVAVLPPTSRQQWELLWEAAAVAAGEAAQLTVPNPVFVAQDHTTEVWRAEGAEGAALVAVPDEPSGFATWLRRTGRGGAGPRSGTWVAAPVRGYDGASAWADTFAEVLGWHGIDCEVYAMLDGPNPPHNPT
ncbi:hypothetical protein KXD97_32450 (plasmid) [Mycobacterium sp. SMC-8]|uniref:DUF6883 domain-containing protein n=1 Tax=Mycobacterium sp. SMC-8 TaxID=2857060 RepID=UPI0021B28A67|nr:DUF6883 domain-containing protein [Mycobacterium sp. SMC-8]UXA15854.1 hypothetical protein KXD97_32450 [Mycobacterium sp. SMC-8]